LDLRFEGRLKGNTEGSRDRKKGKKKLILQGEIGKIGHHAITNGLNNYRLKKKGRQIYNTGSPRQREKKERALPPAAIEVK